LIVIAFIPLVLGREYCSKGVRLIKVRAGDAIAAVAKVMSDDDDDVELDEDGNKIISENNESLDKEANDSSKINEEE